MVTKRFRITRRQLTRRSRKYRMRGGARKAIIDIYINNEKLNTSLINSKGYDWEHLRQVIATELLKPRLLGHISDDEWVKINNNEDGFYNGLLIDSGSDDKEIIIASQSFINIPLFTYTDDDGDVYIESPLTGLEYLLLDERKDTKQLKIAVRDLYLGE